MVKKVVWFLLSLLIVMTMVLVSCKTETTTTTGGTTTVTGTVTNPTTPAPPAETPAETTHGEKPVYGGTANVSLAADITGFDEAFVAHNLAYTLHLTNEELVQGDWTKGPAGTDEANYILGGINAWSLKASSLADNWEIPERGKIIFHIREGIKWHNKPPTNGRELTVEDVVFSLQRMCTLSTSYIRMAYPSLAKSAVITGDNAARTVTIEVPVSEWANCLALLPDFCTIMPKDAIEFYGDLNNWKNSIGTGAFILTDFVSNGSATFIRNDNFWETNPIGSGKGDQLPYLNNIKVLIIADTATRITAFRTAKLDSMGGEYDDVKEFLDNPDVKSMSYISDSCYAIAMRLDKPESPFSKKEVRQALMFATDFNQIKNDFYGGRASILVWPMSYNKENAAAYVPMEQLPANVQELYSYNPTKARELLTAAGYPTLNISIICYNTATQVDYLSMIQKMWSQVGVTLTLDAKDYATWIARVRARNYGAYELLFAYTSGVWHRMININGASQYNMSYINDVIVAEAAAKAPDYVGIDEAGLAKIHADLMPYVLEQAWVIPKPNAYSYVVWWDWRRNWDGELQVGYYNFPSYMKYVWVDQAVKKEMTGK